MSSINSPGSKLNILLPQTPNVPDPQLNGELQGIYNALHILNAYMQQLREEYEGNDSQNPAQSMRFRRRYTSVALQPIQAGNIVSAYGNGHVNGVQTPPTSYIIFSVDGRYGPWRPALFTRDRRYVIFEVALTSAAIGEPVIIGADSGVVALDGAVAGTIYWAHDRLEYTGYCGATNGTAMVNGLASTALAGLGQMGLNNTQYRDWVGSLVNFWSEGYMPYGRYRSGDLWYAVVRRLFPVGIGIAPGYVLVNQDYIRSEWPPG